MIKKAFSKRLPLLAFLLLQISIISAKPIPNQQKQVQYRAHLFFTEEKIGQLKQQIKQDTVIKNAWLTILAKADKAVAQENYSGSVEDLGLAYRMTGDQKYAIKIKQVLVMLCQKPHWEGEELLNRNPPWNAGLQLAENCYKAAVGFDCIADFLSEKDRISIAGSIIKLGIKPALGDWVSGDNRIHSLNSMGHNWWSACVFMAGVASLAIVKEERQAKVWVETVARASLEWFNFSGDVLNNKPRTFDREGGFYESIGYASFAMKEYLLFRLAYTNTFSGQKPFEIPLLNKVGDFFINSTYPTSGLSMMLNFGDAHVDNRDWYPILLLMANGYDKERYHWLLNQLQQQVKPNDRYFLSAFGLAYNQEKVQKKVVQNPDLPESKLYSDMGWGMLRSSWQKDATLLAVKSGDTWNHAHADANSFMLFYQGQNLLTDGGTVFYNSPQYSDYFFQSQAHNVVLFNGEGQSRDDEYFGVKTPGKLYNLIDAGNLKYIYGDATGPTSQNFDRNFRHFLWVGNVILIIDDLKAHEAGKMEWLLHYGDAEAKKEGLNIKVSKEKAHVFVRPLFPETLVDAGFPHDFPEKMILSVKEGIHDHTNNVKENYYSIAVPEKLKQTKGITAIILPEEKDSNLPKIEKIEGKGMIGVKITQNGIVTNVYLNILADGRMMGRNSNNSFDGWETDAYLTAISYPQNKQNDPTHVSQYFISNGSYLRKNGTAMLNSLSKVFMVAQAEKAGMKVWMQGQPLIQADLFSPVKSANVILNNEQVKANYTDQHVKIVVADHEHQAEVKQLKQQ